MHSIHRNEFLGQGEWNPSIVRGVPLVCGEAVCIYGNVHVSKYLQDPRAQLAVPLCKTGLVDEVRVQYCISPFPGVNLNYLGCIDKPVKQMIRTVFGQIERKLKISDEWWHLSSKMELL